MIKKIKRFLLGLIPLMPEIAIVILLLFGKWKAALYVFGSLLFIIWTLMYIGYRLMILQSIILYSAGRMKTGNDLAKQVEKTLKNKDIPNFFQFYWGLYRKCRGIK